MSEDLFRGLVRECAAAGTVEKMALMGLGEPFLHPRLIEMSRVAKRAGIRHVFTSTNGTTVNEETAARIVLESGFDEICFSVDGANSATYEGVRSRGAYEAVVRNVERMFRMRARWGRSRPHFVVQLLLMRETAGEVERFVSRWRPWLRLGDRMSIRDVDRFGGLVEDRRVRDPHAGRVRAPCKQLWRDAAVSWDGKVTVCCKDVYWRLSVADATKQSLREIWRSAAWNRLRDLHREGRYEALPICRNCSEWHT
ncbi:MAG: SPASM domain-containing protein [Planctomycetes bacterium]|nr:SPASM domain-containing protein [Planctomycetota bacterium]